MNNTFYSTKAIVLFIIFSNFHAACSPSPKALATQTARVSDPTPVLIATKEPAITESFTDIKNVVYTHFEDPSSATWVLYIELPAIIDANFIENSEFNLDINKITYNLDNVKIINNLNKYGGIIFDYDEGLFLESDLFIELEITQYHDSQIIKSSIQIPNWQSFGLITIPQDHSTKDSILNSMNIIVCELDDYDSSEAYKSSLTEQSYGKWSIDNYGNVHGGFEPNDANAIDLAYGNLNDDSVVFISLPIDVEVYGFNYFESFHEKGIMDSNLQFKTPVSVIVEEENRQIRNASLIWRIGHLNYSQKKTPILGPLLNHSISQIPKDTIIGYSELQGQGHVIMNIAVYADYCKNNTNCEWQNPGEDPDALILPFSLFINSEQKKEILDAFYRGNPNDK